MFILSFLWGLLELSLVGAALFYVWIDYRRGFPSARRAIDWAYETGLRIFHLNEGEKKLPGKIVNNFAKRLAVTREAVATLQANYEIATRKALEQKKLMTDFCQLGEESLRQNDDDTALAAAEAMKDARQRMEMYEEAAQEQFLTAEELQKQLERQERQFGVVSSRAETIELNNMLAEGRKQLYSLVSDVEAETGLTMRGTLNYLLEESERNSIKSKKLLESLHHSSNGKVHDMIESNDVRLELEAMRQRIALPEGTVHENGVVKIQAAEEDIIVQ